MHSCSLYSLICNSIMTLWLSCLKIQHGAKCKTFSSQLKKILIFIFYFYFFVWSYESNFHIRIYIPFTLLHSQIELNKACLNAQFGKNCIHKKMRSSENECGENMRIGKKSQPLAILHYSQENWSKMKIFMLLLQQPSMLLPLFRRHSLPSK